MIILKYKKQLRTSKDIAGFHRCLQATGLPLAVVQRRCGVMPALRLSRKRKKLSELFGL